VSDCATTFATLSLDDVLAAMEQPVCGRLSTMRPGKNSHQLPCVVKELPPLENKWPTAGTSHRLQTGKP
jgi:hypothetical protein